MSGKRYSSNYDDGYLNGIYNILDNGIPLEHYEIVDLLNNLSEENEWLKKENTEYIHESSEKDDILAAFHTK